MILRTGTPRRRGNLGIGLIIAAVAVLSYCSSQEHNAVTGRTQYLSMTPEQEIALGLETAPLMAQEHGGLSTDPQASERVEKIGARLVTTNREATANWQFKFHLLADPRTVNAFALPGGQIFITEGLYHQLKSDDQLAGVLAHEIGHVAGRHSAAQLAKQQLSQGLTGAAVVASGDATTGQMAAIASHLMNLRYGRDDELESDALAVRFMAEAGYKPEAMIEVLHILARNDGRGGPEFFSTHPNPDHRIAQLEEIIATAK